ncbi:MAG: hypothetical protein ACPGRX_06605 [Bdellovibrionales bacterium]
MQKITVEVPKAVLASAKEYVNGGTTEAVREGLRKIAHEKACQELAEMRGIWKGKVMSPTLEEMRRWEEDDPDNPWNKGHGE